MTNTRLIKTALTTTSATPNASAVNEANQYKSI